MRMYLHTRTRMRVADIVVLYIIIIISYLIMATQLGECRYIW